MPEPSQSGGMIRVTRDIVLNERAIELHFIRASGPGGQNVNKVATAVQLRFALDAAQFPEPVRVRLKRIAGRRVTQEGILVITAARFRSQERNRADALERLVALIRRAAEPVTIRRPTRPTAAAAERRRKEKTLHARLKRLRSHVRDDTA
jgi:ribosome-associated protein